MKIIAATLPALAFVPALALMIAAAPLGATSHDGHAGHGMGMTAQTPSPATEAFAEANARMHATMTMDYTGNADVDFVRGMIPHHQGAVDMARIVLDHGSDPEIRKLAQAVIASQEAEISFMLKWLEENQEK